MGWTFPREVRGYLLESEAKLLAELACEKRVLEIGSFCGRSTISMAQVAQEVVAVDHHKGDADVGQTDTLKEFTENLTAYGVASKVKVHVKKFADVCRDLPEKYFDLAFVDGAHDAESAAHDTREARRLVRNGGIVAVHDWDVPGVRQGVSTVFDKASKIEGRIALFHVGGVNVEIAIPSRDGRIDDDVLTRANDACMFAAKRGIECGISRPHDSYNVATCRNRGVAGFLSREQRTHLLFLDDDVLLPANAVHELATAADRLGGVVCGCVPSVRIASDGETRGYVQVKPVDGLWLEKWPTEEVEVEACGGGCMMISRDVFSKIEFPWFRWPETYRPKIGVNAKTDDADFCERVRAAGVRVTAIPSVRCGHKKKIDVAMLIGE